MSDKRTIGLTRLFHAAGQYLCTARIGNEEVLTWIYTAERAHTIIAGIDRDVDLVWQMMVDYREAIATRSGAGMARCQYDLSQFYEALQLRQIRKRIELLEDAGDLSLIQGRDVA